jgi:hypothetical protein
MFVLTHKESNVKFSEFLNVFSTKIPNIILCKCFYAHCTKITTVRFCEFLNVFSIRIANSVICIGGYILRVR